MYTVDTVIINSEGIPIVSSETNMETKDGESLQTNLKKILIVPVSRNEIDIESNKTKSLKPVLKKQQDVTILTNDIDADDKYTRIDILKQEFKKIQAENKILKEEATIYRNEIKCLKSRITDLTTSNLEMQTTTANNIKLIGGNLILISRLMCSVQSTNKLVF